MKEYEIIGRHLYLPNHYDCGVMHRVDVAVECHQKGLFVHCYALDDCHLFNDAYFVDQNAACFATIKAQLIEDFALDGEKISRILKRKKIGRYCAFRESKPRNYAVVDTNAQFDPDCFELSLLDGQFQGDIPWKNNGRFLATLGLTQSHDVSGRHRYVVQIGGLQLRMWYPTDTENREDAYVGGYRSDIHHPTDARIALATIKTYLEKAFGVEGVLNEYHPLCFCYRIEYGWWTIECFYDLLTDLDGRLISDGVLYWQMNMNIDYSYLLDGFGLQQNLVLSDYCVLSNKRITLYSTIDQIHECHFVNITPDAIAQIAGERCMVWVDDARGMIGFSLQDSTVVIAQVDIERICLVQGSKCGFFAEQAELEFHFKSGRRISALRATKQGLNRYLKRFAILFGREIEVVQG